MYLSQNVAQNPEPNTLKVEESSCSRNSWQSVQSMRQCMLCAVPVTAALVAQNNGVKEPYINLKVRLPKILDLAFIQELVI